MVGVVHVAKVGPLFPLAHNVGPVQLAEKRGKGRLVKLRQLFYSHSQQDGPQQPVAELGPDDVDAAEAVSRLPVREQDVRLEAMAERKRINYLT